MNKVEKQGVIDGLTEKFGASSYFYFADASGLTVEVVNKLRRSCFEKGIGLQVAKNTLIKKALVAFKLFQLGDWIDGMNGTGFTTFMVIDMLRSQSWQRGMDLQKTKKNIQQMHNICISDFKIREDILQIADDAKLLY